MHALAWGALLICGSACTLINPTGEVVRLGEGGAPPSSPLECKWVLARHRVVKSLKDAPPGERQWDTQPFVAVPLHTDLRVFVDRQDIRGLDVYTLEEVAVAEARYPATNQLQDALPIGGTRIGVLLDQINGNDDAQLMLLLLSNLDFDGQAGTLSQLSSASAFSSAEDNDVAARFVPLGDGGPLGNHVAFVARQLTPSGFILEYGRSEGAPVDPVDISAADPSLNTQDSEPRSYLLDRNGTNHLFVGLPGSTQGPRIISFADAAALPVEPRLLGTSENLMVDVGLDKDGAFNVALGVLSESIAFLTGKVPLAEIDTFDVGDLVAAGSFETLNSLPLATNPRWIRNMLPLVGPRFDSSDVLAVLIADANGLVRAHLDMPFLFDVGPGIKRDILAATVAENFSFDFSGGELNIVWIESHVPDSDPAAKYHVMFTNRLSCVEVP